MGRVRGAVGVSLIEVMARCQSRGRSGLQPFTKSGLQTCLSESLTNPCNFLGMEIRNGLFVQAKKKKGGEGDFKSLDSLPAEMGKPGEREKHELPI